jgi:hypothetical protein
LGSRTQSRKEGHTETEDVSSRQSEGRSESGEGESGKRGEKGGDGVEVLLH